MSVALDQRILITGGTGFAGSHLVEYLLERGVSPEKIWVTHLDSFPTFLAHLLPESQRVRLNLIDESAVQEAFKKISPTWIFHLAAIASVGDSFDQAREVLSNNQSVQLSVLNALRHSCPEARLLSVGSADSYGLSAADEIPITETHPFRPVNPYAVSKITQEMLSVAYTQSFSLDIVRVRPFNHIGERQSPAFAIPSFARQIVAVERGDQSEIKVGNISAIRDFTDVKDMVRAYVAVMEQGKTGEVYNIGSGIGVKVSEVLDQLTELAEARITVVQDQSRIRPLDIQSIIANNTKIATLGWKPEIPLSETLRRVLTYWRAQ